MSNRWISQAGAGTLAGTSFANRAPISDFVAQEAAVGAGEYLRFSAETITLPFALLVTNTNKLFVGVNVTTGTDDGSIATLDAGNTYVNCIDAFIRNYCKFKNLELIRATGDGLKTRKCFIYNVKSRNNGGQGMYDQEQGVFDNCHANNNTTNGIRADYTGVILHSQSIGNSATGMGGLYALVDESIIHNNLTGCGPSGIKIINSVLDGNTTGLTNATGGGYISNITKSSITNNTTGLTTDATDDIIETDNYFYNNTTKLGGTTANIHSFGASQDGIINPYTNQPGDDFTPSATAPMVNLLTKIGMLAESLNKTYSSSGFNPTPLTPAITVTDINPATGASGASIVITGTNFTGSGNIVKLGGSGGTSCTITAQSTTSITFTVPAIATGTYDVYIENSSGTNIVVPNGFILTSATIPVFAGIVNFEILSNNKFYIKTGTATNSPIYLVYYIRTATNPFGIAYSFKLAYSANKELVIGEESGHFAPLVAGTTYYCGVRAENANGEDVNVVELSNICSGTAMIQRQTITVLSAK